MRPAAFEIFGLGINRAGKLSFDAYAPVQKAGRANGLGVRGELVVVRIDAAAVVPQLMQVLVELADVGAAVTAAKGRIIKSLSAAASGWREIFGTAPFLAGPKKPSALKSSS